MMIAELLPPAFWLYLAAILIPVTSGHVRGAIAISLPIVALWSIWQVEDAVMISAFFLDQGIELVQGSPVRRLFATIFAQMAGVGGLYAYKIAGKFELAAAFAYAGGAVGIAFAGDLLTLFLYWELMAIFSTLVVWFGGHEKSRAAGMRYAMVHFFGGIVLMVGILGVYIDTGSLDIRSL